MHGLRQTLADAGVTQASMARHLGIARSTMCGICDGRYPVGREAELKGLIREYLRACGSTDMDWEAVHEEPQEEAADEAEERRVEMLTMAARKQFGLYKDPFADDVHDASDVYLTDSVRYVSEYMHITAKSSGMLAVIGESGSGKSTLRKLLIDRILQTGEKIRIIFPRTLDRTRLTASAICDAIVQDVSDARVCRSFEAKCRQVEKVLTESSRAGWSHVLMIEEAHDLDIRTLKYLKRFWELEDGFKRLLGVILIAQPELKFKLDEARNWEARELIRRMEVAELDPFIDASEVRAYLDLKLSKAGATAEKVFDDDAYAAIIDSMSRRTKAGQRIRYCYPLSVNNIAKRAMNEASAIFAPKVNAELIKASI